MNIRELTDKVVQPRMAKINVCPGDTYLVEKLMREAVNAAVTQALKDVAQGADDIFKEQGL
jgi:hypothetical protein